MKRHHFILILLMLLISVLPNCWATPLLQSFSQQLDIRLSAKDNQYVVDIITPSDFQMQGTVDAFALSDPSRLVVDVFGQSQIRPEDIPLARPPVSMIRIGRHAEKIRIVFDLDFPLRSEIPIEKIRQQHIRIWFEPQHAPVAQAPAGNQPIENPPSQQQHHLLPGQGFTVSGDKIEVVPVDPGPSFSKTGKFFEGQDPLGGPSADAMLTPQAPAQEQLEGQSESLPIADPAEELSVSREVLPDDKPVSAQVPLLPKRIKETFVDYSDLYPPGSPPLHEDSTWVWQLAFVLLLITFLTVMLKRRQALRLMTEVRDYAPYLPDAEFAVRSSYETLGVDLDCTDEELRATYRRLVKAFHSDRLASHDLPEEVLHVTDDQFKRIQDAYESVKRARGLD